MKITIVDEPIKTLKTGTIVVPLFADVENTTHSFEQLDAAFDHALSTAVEQDADFHKHKRSFSTMSLGKIAAQRVVLMSLGDPAKVTLDTLRKAIAKCVNGLQNYQEKSFTFLSPCYALDFSSDDVYYALAEGAMLGSYTCDSYKSKKAKKEKNNGKPNTVSFYLEKEEVTSSVQKGIDRAQLICTYANTVKDLANGPSNIVTPTYLVETARKLAKKTKLKFRVLDERSMRREGMGCLLAVSKGSAEKPALIILEYKGRGVKGKKPIAIVGKGVTFDSGGLNLKPGAYMDTMKEDMTGAAVVMQTIGAVAALKLPLHIVCVIPTVENMPSGTATKPSDIVTASNGKTVEIMNTDAEGRLILADALHYANRFNPELIIDFATLTGASFVALGKIATPVMGTIQDVIDDVIVAGKQTGERCWQLPLFEEYSEAIKSDLADIKNIGGPKGEAGTIAAGVFLKEFVGDTPWVHFDIGGSSWNTGVSGYMQKGSSGVGLRVLVRYMENRAKVRKA